MIAALPMYDLPELRDATDAWWTGLAGHLRAHGVTGVPEALDRTTGRDPAWLSPDLLIGQTCGYPLTHALAGRVRYLATPCYAAPGCTGPNYRSAVIVRADSPADDLAALRGSVCAVNGADSHSGCNVLRRMVADQSGGTPFFGDVVVTGGHRASIAAVAAGRADLAAIDCVTFALLERHAPAETAGVRILCWSMPAPGLPLITAAAATDASVAALRQALLDTAVDDALKDAREALGIAGIDVLDASAYAVIPEMADAARRLGYPELV